MEIDRKVVARGLGLLGIGLGVAELVAPRRMARLAGVDGNEKLVLGTVKANAQAFSSLVRQARSL